MSPVESQKSVILLWDTFHSIIFIAWCVLGLPMCAILMMLNFTCHKWMTPISVKYFLWGPSTLDWYCCGRIICSYVFTYLQPFIVFICFSFFVCVPSWTGSVLACSSFIHILMMTDMFMVNFETCHSKELISGRIMLSLHAPLVFMVHVG